MMEHGGDGGGLHGTTRVMYHDAIIIRLGVYDFNFC